MKSKHTQGEWYYGNSHDDGTFKIYSREQGYIGNIDSILTDSTMRPDRKRNEGNAQLIISAPELLEACKEFLELNKRKGFLSDTCSLINSMDLAVKKAEGTE